MACTRLIEWQLPYSNFFVSDGLLILLIPPGKSVKKSCQEKFTEKGYVQVFLRDWDIPSERPSNHS